jgi:uncharacterized protein
MEYVKRSIESNIISCLQDGQIAILYGPRQIGKTTLAKHVAQSIDQTYSYFNCDEPDIATSLSNKNTIQLASFIGSSKTIVIDEAQRVQNIGITLKLLHDTYSELKIIATGSSSFELADSINEPLTGRAYYFNIYPLSLSEISKNNLFLSRSIERLMVYGSYPAVALEQKDDITSYLTNLTNNYIYRDLLNYGVIRSEQTLLQLLKALALQLGSQVSLNELSNLLSIDIQTVKRLINLLEKAFVIYRLYPMSPKPRSGLKLMNKVYFTDLGVRNTLIGNLNNLDTRTDAGALWENFCINEFRKSNSLTSELKNIGFWRNYSGAEVDYIEQIGGQYHGYEFKYGSKTPKIPKAFQEVFAPISFEVINQEKLIQISLNKLD